MSLIRIWVVLIFLGLLLLQPWWLLKEQCNGVIAVWLIFFHDHQVVPLLIQDLLRQKALGMERIRGRDGVGQITSRQYLGGGRNLIAFRVRFHLRQGDSCAVLNHAD